MPHRTVVVMLMCCLQNDGKINYDIAADSGIGLIIGGNDTSGLGVSALLATLPYFPEVLDKLRKEQEQVCSPTVTWPRCSSS